MIMYAKPPRLHDSLLTFKMTTYSSQKDASKETSLLVKNNKQIISKGLLVKDL